MWLQDLCFGQAPQPCDPQAGDQQPTPWWKAYVQFSYLLLRLKISLGEVPVDNRSSWEEPVEKPHENEIFYTLDNMQQIFQKSKNGVTQLHLPVMHQA